MIGKRYVILCCVNVLCLTAIAFYNPFSVFIHRPLATRARYIYSETAFNREVTLCDETESMLTQTNTADKGAYKASDEWDTRNSSFFITTIFTGKLGNHLFIYATLLGVARALNRRPFIHDGIDLSGTFRISFVNPSINTKGFAVMHTKMHTKFESRFMQLPETNITLDGSFQSWKYFQHIHSEIRREFTLTAAVQKQVNSILAPHRRKLLNNALVGVHVRRGDFIEPDNVKLGYSVPNGTYFAKAFAKMRSLLAKKNVTFLVASDDIQWCRENLLFDGGVTILPQNSPGLDLSVLASCDHMILSGGTFGWWAAWLANGITIYYSNYICLIRD